MLMLATFTACLGSTAGEVDGARSTFWSQVHRQKRRVSWSLNRSLHLDVI